MNKSRKRTIVILFALGMLLILGAPFIPNFIYEAIDRFSPKYTDMRFPEVISSIRTGGILLSVWGIALLFYKK